MEELLKTLEENKELSAKLKKMWQEKASAADIVAVLKENGHDVDISTAEEALQKAQDELAKNVAAEKLDDEALATVAGGGSGINCTAADDCDSVFNRCSDGFVGEDFRCDYNNYCDDLFVDLR